MTVPCVKEMAMSCASKKEIAVLHVKEMTVSCVRKENTVSCVKKETSLSCKKEMTVSVLVERR